MDERTDTAKTLERLRLKYEALRDIAVRAANAEDIGEVSRAALDNAVGIMGMEAGSLTLYIPDGGQTENFSTGSDEYVPIMKDFEQKLIAMLRDDFSVGSLFLTLDKDGPHSLFSYPLVIGGKTFGTISGVSKGKRNLSVEEEFIEAISAQLAMAFLSMSPGESAADLKKAKTEAIIETAVALNHEINNPLTAVLGNVQLLLINRDNLDGETIKKLESIESAALRIKDVTGRLMKTVEPAVTEYVSGVKMVDVDHSSSEGEPSEDDS